MNHKMKEMGRTKMMKGRYGMMYGSKPMRSGGKMGHKSISDMERACSMKTGMNTMSEKRG